MLKFENVTSVTRLQKNVTIDTVLYVQPGYIHSLFTAPVLWTNHQ